VADPRVATLSDDALAEALRDLGSVLAVPVVSASPDGRDPAARARARIEAAGTAGPSWLGRLGLTRSGGRPARRAPVLAVLALLLLAAVAVAAIGFGLPGLRFVFAPAPSAAPSITAGPSAGAFSSASPIPSATPTPTVGPPGADLDLGRPVTLAEARRSVAFALRLPGDPRFGSPDAVWLDDVGRVTMVWTARPGVPGTSEGGYGLFLTAIPGSINPDYFEKVIRPGTTVEPVEVNDATGYWISGSPHEFVYVDPTGEVRYDTGRLIGDTLAWSDGKVTYRLETGLGRDAAIALADGMR
jgi:hypothetical protein